MNPSAKLNCHWTSLFDLPTAIYLAQDCNTTARPKSEIFIGDPSIDSRMERTVAYEVRNKQHVISQNTHGT